MYIRTAQIPRKKIQIYLRCGLWYLKVEREREREMQIMNGFELPSFFFCLSMLCF